MSRKPTKKEEKLLLEYMQWSEEFYCAGFLHPGPKTVAKFIEWQNDGSKLYRSGRITGELEDYELEFLEEYAKQKEEAKAE